MAILKIGDKIKILVDGAWSSGMKEGSIHSVVGFEEDNPESAKLDSGWFAPLTTSEFRGEGRLLGRRKKKTTRGQAR